MTKKPAAADVNIFFSLLSDTLRKRLKLIIKPQLLVFSAF